MTQPGIDLPAQLALRQVLIDTYHENVAYLHRDCEVYRAEGFKALSKIEVRANGRSILPARPRPKLAVTPLAAAMRCHTFLWSFDDR